MNITPLPLALPAPAWCTDKYNPFNRELDKLSDAELEKRAALHGRFFDYILTGIKGRLHLWEDHHQGAAEVEACIHHEIASRWLMARHVARCQAERRRHKKKFRVPQKTRIAA